MKVNAKVEAYLAQLERSLGPVPISEKAEIVMEIKSHIMSALENQPGTNVDQILASLGSPEQVANRYLLERGLRPVKAPGTPIIKWLVLGFLGTGVLFIALVSIMFYSFSPLIDIDDEKGHVSLLGGMIELDESNSTFQIGSTIVKDGFAKSDFEGHLNVAGGSLKDLRIDFTNGKFELETSDDGVLRWDCETRNFTDENFMVESGNEVRLNLQSAAAAECDLKVPPNLKVHIAGPNGKLRLKRPSFEIDAKITNGSVSIRPDKKAKYRYDLSVINGVIDEFSSSPESEAIPVKIALVNGKIDHRGPRK